MWVVGGGFVAVVLLFVAVLALVWAALAAHCSGGAVAKGSDNGSISCCFLLFSLAQ